MDFFGIEQKVCLQHSWNLCNDFRFQETILSILENHAELQLNGVSGVDLPLHDHEIYARLRGLALGK